MDCNTPDCGCVDCVDAPVTPPCTSCECNPGFCDDGCADYPQTTCFIYNGDALPCLNLSPGDSLNSIFTKIDQKYCAISGEDGTDKYVKVSENDTTSNYLIDKINTGSSNVAVGITSPGANEKISLNYTESFKVKTDGTDVENFLINKIVLKQDPLGIVIPQALTNVGGKVAIGFTLNMDALCGYLQDTGCIPATETCPVTLNSMQLTPNENGDLKVNVSYTSTVTEPPLIEYLIDDGEVHYVTVGSFTIHNIGPGNHSIGIRVVCNNGKRTGYISQTFVIPEANVICPNIALTASDNSIAVAWSVLDNYSYTVQISLSEFGAPLQIITGASGSYIFTKLDSAVEYWIRVIPTYLGVTKSVCSAQRILTTQQSCNATVGTPVVSGASSSGTVTLSWTGSGASSYEYRIGLGGSWISTTASSVNLVSQNVGTTTFFLRARCANGLYGTGSQADFTIPAITCTATIDTVSITNINENGTATASWTSTGASSFEYKLGTSGTWVPTTVGSVNLNNQSAGLHTIYVRAKCANGLYGGQNSASFTIPTPVCSASISNVTASNVTAQGAGTISWTGSGAASYEYKVNSGNWIATNLTTVNLTGLTTGTLVSVRGKCTNGLYGNTATVTITLPIIVCAAPGTPVLTDVATSTYLAEWTFTDTDPFAAISSGTSTLTYPHSVATSLGSDLVCDYGAEGNNKYLVQRIQSIEPVKTIWYNTQFNNGTFPDSVYYAPLNKGGWIYYITRDTFVFDATSFSVTLKKS